MQENYTCSRVAKEKWFPNGIRGQSEDLNFKAHAQYHMHTINYHGQGVRKK